MPGLIESVKTQNKFSIEKAVGTDVDDTVNSIDMLNVYSSVGFYMRGPVHRAIYDSVFHSLPWQHLVKAK